MKSLIMASGFGTRLRSANVTRAKGLLEYKGKPLISHIVDRIPQDVDILVNTNKKFEADFRRWQQTLSRNVTLCIEPVFTEEQTFGAVGSLYYWIRTRNITDDLLVIASDNYFELDLLQFLSSTWALATDLVVKGEEARYLALTNLAMAGGSALARLIGPLIDFFNSINSGLGYQVMLLVSLVCFIAGALLILKIKPHQPMESG